MENKFDSSLYKPILITFDGTSASGKGTIVKGLSQLLDSRYSILDAGTMYRALTHYYQIQKNISHRELKNTNDLISRLRDEIKIRFLKTGINVNGHIIPNEELRGPEIDPFVSKYAGIDDIKLFAIELQQEIIGVNPDKNGFILDGRCMGTAVAPNAQAKFFVDAPSLVRATRRHQDYVKSGKLGYSTEEIHIDLENRDRDDYNTNTAPLLKPDDAIEIDSFKFSPDDGVNHAWNYVKRKIIEEGTL